MAAVIRHIASMEPDARHKAYRKLIERGGSGYEEVFLVGLNEDDYEALEVVVSYFRDHHPPQAIEPLLDLLLYTQGDRAMRDGIVDALARFGPCVIDPVVSRLETEPEARIAGGAKKGLEQVLAGAVDRSGVVVLNRFLARAQPAWLLAYGVRGATRIDPPAADADTFEVLARRLETARDPREVEGLLRVAARLARRPDLPGTVSLVVPAAVSRLHGEARRWALYALAMVADARVSRPCRTLARERPQDRFWAYQVLATSRDPRGMEALVRGLADSDDVIRSEAAFLLSLDPVPSAAPALRRLLADPRIPVERAPLVALQRLRDREARPLLEARLEDAPLDVQAEILKTLLAVADADLAVTLEGWTDLALLAPARLGRISLDEGPGKDAFLSALLIIAADGGAHGRAFLERLARERDGDAAAVAAGFLELSHRLGKGWAQTLALSVFGGKAAGVDLPPTPKAPAAPSLAMKTLPRRVWESLYLLCPRRADAGTREVLEGILLHAPRYRDRVLAADALAALEDPASIPALQRALADPWFQDGPYPLYRYPVRRAAARGLERLGVRVVRSADRHFMAYPQVP